MNIFPLYTLVKKFIQPEQEASNLEAVLTIVWTLLFTALSGTFASIAFGAPLGFIPLFIIWTIVSLGAAITIPELSDSETILGTWVKISLGIPALVLDVATLPFRLPKALYQYAKKKFNRHAMEKFLAGNIRRNRIEPFLINRGVFSFSEKRIYTVLREIVRDQLERDLHSHEDKSGFVKETISIKNSVIIDQCAWVHFRVELRSSRKGREKLLHGNFFVKLHHSPKDKAVRIESLTHHEEISLRGDAFSLFCIDEDVLLYGNKHDPLGQHQEDLDAALLRGVHAPSQAPLVRQQEPEY